MDMQRVPREDELVQPGGRHVSIVSTAEEWQAQVEDLTVDELEGAGHREILADKRLHQLLVDYCCAKYAVPEDKV